MRTLPPLPEWVALEHEVAHILSKQERHGWYFDERAAWKLASSLEQELSDLKKVLRKKHPYIRGNEFTPKRDNKTSGYIKGAPFTRQKEFNPVSRDHVAWVLIKCYDLEPQLRQHMTATGKHVIDEVVLTEIGSEIAMQFARCLKVTKMLGMLSNGVNAWLKLVTTSSRIHHHCSVNTATHRCSHKSPNLAQCMKEEEFRALFKPTPGLVMCGADLSGVELRMLAHYLSRYDPTFGDILLNGDIHQVNADKVGVSRRAIKTITYAWCYGAGDEKIGFSYDKQLSPEKAKKKGKEIRKAFVAGIPGMNQLLSQIKERAADGHIKSIDGRVIKLRSPHMCLNYLLQSGSAVLAKRQMVIVHNHIKQLGLSASQLAFIHDELQFECPENEAADLSASLVLSAAEAGEYYKLRIPIAAEAKVGASWAEVH
jgi:DNA polymerase I-like protein with 3'-5' exonuclease and polymerase domains